MVKPGTLVHGGQSDVPTKPNGWSRSVPMSNDDEVKMHNLEAEVGGVPTSKHARGPAISASGSGGVK